MLRWYAASINATDALKTIQLDLRQLSAAPGATLITDGATNRSFSTRAVAGATVSISLPTHRGFVLQLQ